MSTTINSAALVGVRGVAVTVEAEVSEGTGTTTVQGLSEGAARETRQRVKSAIRNSGYAWPTGLVAVNVVGHPGGDSSHYDLPIGLAILSASGQMPEWRRADEHVVLGELGLSGAVRPVRGVLPMVMDVGGVRVAVVPEGNASEALVAIPTTQVGTLAEAVDVLRGVRPVRPVAERTPDPDPPTTIDMAQIRGNRTARRAVEIAAAGRHSMLLCGPPGVGKTLLARCLAGLQSDMTAAERIEISRVYSASGQLPRAGLVTHRPFRAPHHTASTAAIIGVGTGTPRPGEVSLAHGGVLFLDELSEFYRAAREVLRGPLASGEVVARAALTARMPARFQLVASTDPCPCGYFGVRDAKECRCDPRVIERYQARLSPIREQIDLTVRMLPVSRAQLLSDTPEESTADVRGRVEAAYCRQLARQGCANADAPIEMLRSSLDNDAAKLMGGDLAAAALDAQRFDRVLRVARTIADLEQCDLVGRRHVAEALCFRSAP